MEPVSSFLPLGAIESLAMMPHAGVIMPLAIAALMALAVASSLPGTLTPVAFLGGAMLGYPGIFFGALGAVIGSQILFVLSRYWLGAYMQRRFGARMDKYRDHLATRGPFYIAGLRLGGVPHVLLTATCAAAPISGRSFAAASLLGMLPAITLGALAGHALI